MNNDVQWNEKRLSDLFGCWPVDLLGDDMSDFIEHLPLFDAPIARNTDPETSHEAADGIAAKRSGLYAEFMRRLRARGCPSTANEIAENNESIRKRAGELERHGWIVSTGTKSCSVTGKRATTYWIA